VHLPQGTGFEPLCFLLCLDKPEDVSKVMPHSGPWQRNRHLPIASADTNLGRACDGTYCFLLVGHETSGQVSEACARFSDTGLDLPPPRSAEPETCPKIHPVNLNRSSSDSRNSWQCQISISNGQSDGSVPWKASANTSGLPPWPSTGQERRSSWRLRAWPGTEHP
jgi:hypothetical protein